MAQQLSPKTPSKTQGDAAQLDDSFMTCKDSMPTPATRYQLRMTSTRTSIMSGATPFKEAPIGSAARRANRSKPKNDTIGSNDTFVMREQELLFDRDSLEITNNRFSSTPKQTTKLTPAIEEPSPTGVEVPQEEKNPVQSEKTKEPAAEAQLLGPSRQSLSKQPTFLKDKAANTSLDSLVPQIKQQQQIRPTPRWSPKRSSSRNKKSPAKIKSKSPSRINKMPPPPPPPSSSRTVTESIRKRFVTPKAVFRKPVNLMGTASRYLSQWNNSRLTRTQSYKSTAELERDYFTSLRSF